MRHYNHPYRETTELGDLLRSALLWGALGALVVNSLRACTRTHRSRRDARPQPLPHKLQTWEGEGGRPDPEPEQAPPGAKRDTGTSAGL